MVLHFLIQTRLLETFIILLSLPVLTTILTYHVQIEFNQTRKRQFYSLVLEAICLSKQSPKTLYTLIYNICFVFKYIILFCCLIDDIIHKAFQLCGVQTIYHQHFHHVLQKNTKRCKYEKAPSADLALLKFRHDLFSDTFVMFPGSQWNGFVSFSYTLGTQYFSNALIIYPFSCILKILVLLVILRFIVRIIIDLPN